MCVYQKDNYKVVWKFSSSGFRDGFIVGSGNLSEYKARIFNEVYISFFYIFYSELSYVIQNLNK